MLEAATLACSYVREMTQDEFLRDKKTQQAVVLNLLLIGEEATKVMRDHETFTREHPQVPWRGMRGMRNRIAHSYFEIDLITVWDT